MNTVGKNIKSNCYYCDNDGLYVDFTDTQEISVCFFHISRYAVS